MTENKPIQGAVVARDLTDIATGVMADWNMLDSYDEDQTQRFCVSLEKAIAAALASAPVAPPVTPKHIEEIKDILLWPVTEDDAKAARDMLQSLHFDLSMVESAATPAQPVGVPDNAALLAKLRDMSGKRYSHSWGGWVQEQCTKAADEIERLNAAAQPVAAIPDTLLDIPNGVYYSAEPDNFYSMMSKQGMGRDFYMEWRECKHLFPQDDWKADAKAKRAATLPAIPEAGQSVADDLSFWRDGAPDHPWDKEWFIAQTTYGDRVVLKALDKDFHSYDYTTADKTYIKRDSIKCWMQFHDSEYVPAPEAQYPAVMLTRMEHTEMCEVSLCINKEWVVVLRDNGTNISHIVEPLGIRREIERHLATMSSSSAAEGGEHEA